MRKTTLLLSALFLAGCSASGQQDSLDSKLQNPLFAEMYWVDLVNTLANIEINTAYPQNKDLLADPSRLLELQAWKEKGVKNAQDAGAALKKGLMGDLIPVDEQPSGRLLLVGNTLYTSQTFNTPTGPSLHLYVSSAVDPLGGGFPDSTAKDLGVVMPYGAASYEVPDAEAGLPYVSAVLYDTVLKRVYGYTQLREPF